MYVPHNGKANVAGVNYTTCTIPFLHVHSSDKAQVFQQPQAPLTAAPMTTSQVTQAPQTITPPPSQDYSQYTSGTLSAQGREMNIQLMSENEQADTVLTEQSGISCGLY